MKYYLFTIVLWFAAFCGVARSQVTAYHRIDTVLSRGSGVAANVSPYAKIFVCVQGTNCVTKATIYADYALT